jgi:hypothetical protein
MGSTNWFYMPSISFNTTTNGTFTKDLYELYYEQFSITDLADGVAPAESRTGTLIKSTSAPASVPYIPGRADLYYYITAYDPGVFSGIAISDDGIMTYTVTAAATDCSYINIIFVLK